MDESTPISSKPEIPVRPIAQAFHFSGKLLIAEPAPTDDLYGEILQNISSKEMKFEMEERIRQALSQRGVASVEVVFWSGSIEFEGFVQILEWIALAGGIVQAAEYLSRVVEVGVTEAMQRMAGRFQVQASISVSVTPILNPVGTKPPKSLSSGSARKSILLAINTLLLLILLVIQLGGIAR